MTIRAILAAATILVLSQSVLSAGESVPDRAEELVLGPVTNFPLPRFVSIKRKKVNVRRGPSESHRVDWVYQLANMPLQITAEFGHWRRVRDIDGAGGWVHFALLSGVRTVIVQKDYTPMRTLPDVGSDPVAYAEQGVVAFLGDCGLDWCQIQADGHRGWVLKTELWGVDAEELRP